MHSFHLIQILLNNNAIKWAKNTPKHNAGKKLPVESMNFTGSRHLVLPNNIDKAIMMK